MNKEKYLGDWPPLYKEIEKPYMKKILGYLKSRRNLVLPSPQNVFRAFKMTALKEVRVVFIAQDPYPDPQHAEGLAFSSPSAKTPDSLRNIKELLKKSGFTISDNNSLLPWCAKGVLLLNTHLTTEKYKTGAHQHLGWNDFTSEAVKAIEKYNNYKVVYALTGKHAHSYEKLIINPSHTYIMTSHPTSRSCYREGTNYSPFMFSDLFNRINEKLEEPINFGI